MTCSLWGCIVQAVAWLVQGANQLVRDERLPINHGFSWVWCTPKHTRGITVQLLAAHLPRGRLPEYTHSLSWKYCRPTGNAGEGGDTLEQDWLCERCMIFKTTSLSYLVSAPWEMNCIFDLDALVGLWVFLLAWPWPLSHTRIRIHSLSIQSIEEMNSVWNTNVERHFHLFIMLRAQESGVTSLNSKLCKNCSTQSPSA